MVNKPTITGKIKYIEFYNKNIRKFIIKKISKKRVKIK